MSATTENERMSLPPDLPLESLPLQPTLPVEEVSFVVLPATMPNATLWTSPTEVMMRLNAEQLRELEAAGDLKLLPPELKASEVQAKLENRQQTLAAPQPVNSFLDVSPRVIGEKTLDDEEAIPREPWQFSLQEMFWASLVVLLGVAFTRAIVSHPVFLAFGILAWCGLFVLGRLHFRDPERIGWLAVQAIGFTYISILWIGWTF
jgi:hypothetical protein